MQIAMLKLPVAKVIIPIMGKVYGMLAFVF